MFISQASKRRRFCQLVLVRNTANDSHDDQTVNNVRRMQISWDGEFFDRILVFSFLLATSLYFLLPPKKVYVSSRNVWSLRFFK